MISLHFPNMAYAQIDTTENTTVTINVKGHQTGNLLPVVVTQNMSSHAYFPNKFDVWNIYFEPYLYKSNGQTRIIQTLPLKINATDGNQQNILENTTRYSVISDDLLYSNPVFCDRALENAGFGKFFLTISNTTSIALTYSNTALKPDSNGVYHLQFSSFSDAKINLPSDANILTNETNVCYEKNRGQKVNLYDLSFNLRNDLISAPEFPFAIPVFLTSIASLIVFYRIKFR